MPKHQYHLQSIQSVPYAIDHFQIAEKTAIINFTDPFSKKTFSKAYAYMSEKELFKKIYYEEDLFLKDYYIEEFSLDKYRKHYQLKEDQIIPLYNLKVVNCCFSQSVNHFFNYAEFFGGKIEFNNCRFNHSDIFFRNCKFNNGTCTFNEVIFGHTRIDFCFSHFEKCNLMFMKNKFLSGFMNFHKTYLDGCDIDYEKSDLGDMKFNFRKMDLYDAARIYFTNNIHHKNFMRHDHYIFKYS